MSSETHPTPTVENDRESDKINLELARYLQTMRELDETIAYRPKLEDCKQKETAQKNLEAAQLALQTLKQELDDYVSEADHPDNIRRDRIAQIIYETERKIKGINTHFATTKEFYLTVKELQQLIYNIIRIANLHMDAGVNFGNQLVGLAKEYSEEGDYPFMGMLTHGTPTETMYQILKDGKLRSIAAAAEGQERFHVNEQDRWGQKHECETHDICFAQGNIYRNFSSEPTPNNKQRKSNIALIFSRNQLLSEGLQFVLSDGLHLFDKNYKKTSGDSTALVIDLKTAPHMIAVTASELDNLINYLKTCPAYEKYLNAENPDDVKDWIDQNIVVVDEIDEFKKPLRGKEMFENLRKKFINNAKYTPKKGYIETAGTTANFKFQDELLCQFVPFE